MRIMPFRAWMPPPALAAKVAAVPYDVVDTEEARALATGNPASFLHVTRPDIGWPPGATPTSEELHWAAAANWTRFCREGIFGPIATPALFLYRLSTASHSQTGIAACCDTQEYEAGIIRTHEKTRRDKEDDRTDHIRALAAHDEPVLLAYRDHPQLLTLSKEIEAAEPPLFDFVAPDGVRHTMWRIAQSEMFVRLFQEVPLAYIADGHHRAAAAARIAREASAASADADERRFFAAALFPASQLRILPYHRCVRDLNGLSTQEFLRAISKLFIVRDVSTPEPQQPGRFCLFLENRWYECSWEPTSSSAPVAELDVSVLQNRLLQPVLNIADPRTSPRLEFVGGIRGTAELERRVRSGLAAAAFAMHPTTLDQLMAIADAGGIMPPKSTWFEPKLRSGLFVHSFAQEQ